MERNVRLVLAYDGTDFHGWQTQPGQRTVQETVEQAIRRVIRHRVVLLGASRTDAGVHARGQVANFVTDRDIPCDNLRRAIGGRLPKDVSLYHVRDVPLSFRASRDAISKLYRYMIHNDSDRPVADHRQRYVYHFWNPLDVHLMQAAARLLVGTHDFAAWATTGHQRLTTVRTIFRAEVHQHFQEIRIDFEGDGFLYNQVRNMVGTLIEIGRGHWPVEKLPEILASRDRRQAGPTAPARGLCLEWIRYDLTRLPPEPAAVDLLPDEQPAETDKLPDAGEDQEPGAARAEARGSLKSTPTASTVRNPSEPADGDDTQNCVEPVP